MNFSFFSNSREGDRKKDNEKEKETGKGKENKKEREGERGTGRGKEKEKDKDRDRDTDSVTDSGRRYRNFCDNDSNTCDCHIHKVDEWRDAAFPKQSQNNWKK